MKQYKIIGFAILAYFLTSANYCQDALDRLESVDNNLGGLNNGIHTTSTVEVKLEEDLQEQVDQIVAQTLNSIRQEVAVFDQKLYFRELVKTGDNIALTQCCAFDLVTPQTHTPFFSDVCWNANLKASDASTAGEEEAACLNNWPLPEEWDGTANQDTSGNFDQEA